MTFTYSKEFSSGAFTDVENIFIYEYLPLASGDAVKVYLYGLFLCKNQNFDEPLEKIADTLGFSVEKIIDLFVFWEEFGLVNILSKNPLTVEYLPVKNAGFAKAKKYSAEKYSDFTKALQIILPKRMISTNEYTEYFSIMETFGIKPEAMLMIVKYCVDRKGEDIGYRYISKVAKDFGSRGIITVESVEKELSSYVLRTGEISKILKAMSLKRQPDIEDLNFYKKWTQELNFEPDTIVFAASKIKKGGMTKLDEFIMELYSMKYFSKEEVAIFMDEKKKVFDLAFKINKALSVYSEVLDTVVDTYTKKWLSLGFTPETLLFIASHCFKEGKNSLQYMDELTESLYSKGIITLSSVGDHFEEQKKNDEFLSHVLLIAGVNRHPNSWDRSNLSTWKSWNFSDDMILEAAKLASGKSSPIPYMNGILSNWKNSGVYTTEEKEKEQTNSVSPAEYNLEYERRREKALLKMQKNNEIAMGVEGFAQIYSRLSGIERDLAFAEISKNEEALSALEKEKSDLTKKATSLLDSVGLKLDDLSVKHFCDKCKDTGYVGTKRCDCYDKKIK